MDVENEKALYEEVTQEFEDHHANCRGDDEDDDE